MKFNTTTDFFEFVNENTIPYNSIINNIKLFTNNFEIDSLTNLRIELKTYIDLHKHIHNYSLIVGKIKTGDKSVHNLENLLDIINSILKEQQLKELKVAQNELLNAKKILEEENKRKIDNRKEFQKLIIKKSSEKEKVINDEVTAIEVSSNNKTYKSFVKTFFLENEKSIELFKYLVHNYDNPRKNSTEYTKYNHIYTLLKNEELIYVNQNMYTKVVKELFDFDLTKGGYIKPVESNYIKESLKPKLDYFNSIK